MALDNLREGPKQQGKVEEVPETTINNTNVAEKIAGNKVGGASGDGDKPSHSPSPQISPAPAPSSFQSNTAAPTATTITSTLPNFGAHLQ
ncbi:hypothetical protein CC78DRAFT_341413 [Lojkania enalia]|uniref:Uncharacterized protein n=1 Tax=Lojkania enalia TaxID=147567 RepID=A0A9P4K5B3_9PLEO|nr:hypothetical protein CC78DRAFT_341413 [Didymosphaeria enalia]